MKNHTRYCRSWNIFCWARSLNMNLKGFQCFKKTFVFKGKELTLCPLLGQNLTWLILISDRFIKSNKLPLIPVSLHLDIKWAVSSKSWSCCGSVQVVLVTQPVWYHISSGPCLLTRNPDSGAPYDMNWNNNEALLLLGTLNYWKSTCTEMLPAYLFSDSPVDNACHCGAGGLPSEGISQRSGLGPRWPQSLYKLYERSWAGAQAPEVRPQKLEVAHSFPVCYLQTF